jgi:hypothetical protein
LPILDLRPLSEPSKQHQTKYKKQADFVQNSDASQSIEAMEGGPNGQQQVQTDQIEVLYVPAAVARIGVPSVAPFDPTSYIIKKVSLQKVHLLDSS